MADPYQIVAFILTALLLPAFGYLYLRFRDTRTLLWFLGFVFAMFSMLLRYIHWPWIFTGQIHAWMVAGGHTAMLISSALFIASLTPLRFRIGRLQVLYVIPYIIPLVI